MDARLEQFQQRLNYQFTTINLLRQALTHRSYASDHNQRLEFLGDAVLGLVMADLLYRRWPAATEGQLSQLRSALVNQATLATLARQLELGELLSLGEGEHKSGGRERDSILSDALEAVIGAVYLDGHYASCLKCLRGMFGDLLDSHKLSDNKDAKTLLQELMQAQSMPLPKYDVLSVSGAEHEQEFQVRCTVASLPEPGIGAGRSRKLAEQQAARDVLQKLGKCE